MNKDIKTLKEEMKEVIDNPTFWVEDYGELESMVTFEAEECKLLLDYINQLETNRDDAIELLTKGFNFCENDSQGEIDICNIAINREKKAIEILRRGKE